MYMYDQTKRVERRLDCSEMACLDDHADAIDTNKLSYEIFSILESKFLFGYDDRKLWVPKQISEVKNGVVSVAVVGDAEFHAIKNLRGKVCILSVDGGGGMRGIVSGKALSYLEAALRNKSGNPDARIADYFDVAAGTGVGGIFTSMLFATNDQSRPIFSAEDTWRFLAAEGNKFCRTRRRKTGLLKRVLGRTGGATGSSKTGLEKAMKEVFKDKKTGRSLTLKNTLKPVLIPCYDLISAAPFLFSRADALESDSFDFNLWEVCLATSAEPGPSTPVCMESVDRMTRCIGIDGGLAMSNPTAAAITHVLYNKQEFPFVRGVEDILVLSLGTGGQLTEGSFDHEQVRKWSAEEWARPLARISGEGSADQVDHAVAMAFGHSRSSNYVRVQANGSSFGECGSNVDKVNLLTGIADEILKEKSVESVLFGGKTLGEQSNSEKLDWFAEQLVLEHEQRSCRIAPTVLLKKAISNSTQFNHST